MPDYARERAAHRIRLTALGGKTVQLVRDIARRLANVLLKGVRPDLMEVQLLLDLGQGELARLFPGLMAAHAVGYQQVEKAVRGSINRQRDAVVAKQKPAY